MNNVLEELFAKLDTQLKLRSEFITPKQSETNHIEFKQKRDTRTPDLHVDDKSSFSVAVSAFSNAEGGLLVWGIATGTKQSRDYAKTLKPIKNVDEFAERLRSYLLDAVLPSNPAVRVKTIKNRQGNGFAICLVPPAQDVPVRSMTPPREYWIRSDGRNVKLEHYQIKDMMFRHAHPDLMFLVTSSTRGLPPEQVELQFSFINTGKAIAKYPGWFTIIQSVSVVSVRDCDDASSINTGGAYLTKDLRAAVIHPNGIQHNVGKAVIDRSELEGRMIIQAKWYCEDMTVKEQLFSVDLSRLPEPAQEGEGSNGV